MFIALYEFKVKPGLEAQFEKNWHLGTVAIREHRGSLGSRLHKAQDGTYIAYAQWPNEEIYNEKTALPIEGSNALQLMKEACETVKVLKLMEVTDDLLPRWQ